MRFLMCSLCPIASRCFNSEVGFSCHPHLIPSFHTPYVLVLTPVIREGCPLCVQMSNGLTGRIEMCHGERM